MEYIAITGFQRIMENSEKLVGIKAEITDFSTSMLRIYAWRSSCRDKGHGHEYHKNPKNSDTRKVCG